MMALASCEHHLSNCCFLLRNVGEDGLYVLELASGEPSVTPLHTPYPRLSGEAPATLHPTGITAAKQCSPETDAAAGQGLLKP